MSDTARERILQNMRSALKEPSPSLQEPVDLPFTQWSHGEKIDILKTNLESVRAEVHLTTESAWQDVLKGLLKEKQIKSLLYAPAVDPGKQAFEMVGRDQESGTEWIAYQAQVEELKKKLFEIDAAITGACGAIAENGAIILWPDQNEPRLMSLVPPIHIAVVQASSIFGTFSEAMENEKWNEGMPSNVILVSGPSKTADIELVLAFGVHGPKELIVMIVD